jgi:glycosyltransferase involved in cell wall biosynthesis
MLRLLANDSVTRGHRVALAYGVRSETPTDVKSRLAPELELMPTAWTSRSIGSNLRARRQLRGLIGRWQPHVVHLHSSFAGLVGANVVPRDVPSIYTPHAYAFEMRNQSGIRRTLYRVAEAYVSRRVNVIAAVSRDEARLARESLRAPRITVIENGIPELDRGVAERTQRRRPPLSVCMGRVSPQRQPAACARILAAAQSASEVRWIGGGEPGSSGMRALEAAGVPVTGWNTREEAIRQLGEADVYLHWSAWDGHPLSVLEAIARDVLVVGHDIPPLREILDRRQLCRTEDEAASLIISALRNDGLRADLLSLQRKQAPRYTAGRMLDQWDELYSKLATRVADHRQEPWVLKPAQAH